MFSDSKHIVKTRDVFDFELIESKYTRFSKGILIFKNSKNVRCVEPLLQYMEDAKNQASEYKSSYLWVNIKTNMSECEYMYDAYMIQNDLHICILLDKELPMYKIVCNALSSKDFIITKFNYLGSVFTKIENRTITINIEPIDAYVY